MSLSRFHRWLGLLIAPFIVVASVTGLLLNHTHQLELSKKPLPNFIVKWLYGVEIEDVVSIFQNGRVKIEQHDSGMLFVTNMLVEVSTSNAVARCDASVVGVAEVDQTIVVVCPQKLLLLSLYGELLEEHGASLGVPTPFEATVVVKKNVLLRHDAAVWAIDPNSLALSRIEHAKVEAWGASGLLPPSFFQSPQVSTEEMFSIEHLLLDMHSGRLFGKLGVLWADLVALCLLAMIFSGLTAWWQRRHLQDGSVKAPD